jgi:dihydroorotate dehydrogenase electron transfer subunit
LTETSTASTSAPGANPPLRARAEILSNRAEGQSNWRLVVRVPGWCGSRPGQFLMLSPGALSAVPRTDPLLPRPMAIYRERLEAGGAEVEVLYKVSGRGTSLLAETEPGQLLSVVGPLGRGFSLPPSGTRAVLVGGGTGVASLYGLAAAALGAGAGVSVLLGARSAGELMAAADFSDLGVDLRVATEDGSEGRRGLVTELLLELLGEVSDAAPTLYVCGPTLMMRRCAEIAAEHSVPCVVSLENRMACGFGVCLGCAVPVTAGGYGLVCREGPVFASGDVVWEGLP